MKRLRLFLICSLVLSSLPLLPVVAAVVSPDSRNLYVDCSIETSGDYCYNSLLQALGNLTDGTEGDTMVVWIAPGVYWLDDPDDPAVRLPDPGSDTPFGVKIRCNYLRLQSITGNPEDVVIACNRGQTQGANGNYTMLHVTGSDFQARGITFGNYCNVDLVYAPDHTQDREKRADAIVQAQIAICNGDRYYFKDCRFISRLNLCPFVGASRTLYDNCSFESTDDALNGQCVYLGCDFIFFSSKPLWGTTGGGAVFLDCDIESRCNGVQYMTKSGGQVSLVDCRFKGSCRELRWTPYPSVSERCYQSGVTLNGSDYLVAGGNGTVDMEGLPLLSAYRYDYDNTTVYNVYNLLSGSDEWDPVGQKGLMLGAQAFYGRKLADLPTVMTVYPRSATLVAGQDTTQFRISLRTNTSLPASLDFIGWSLDGIGASIEGVTSNGVNVYSDLQTDYPESVMLIAHTDWGLEAAAGLETLPSRLKPPSMMSEPVLEKHKRRYTVRYTLDLDGREDLSEINWFSASSPDMTDLMHVSASNGREGNDTYSPVKADAGRFLVAVVEPRHIRSDAGAEVQVVSEKPVPSRFGKGDDKHLETDFSDFPAEFQPIVIPGRWTVDGFKPSDTRQYNWSAGRDNWYYGIATDGAVGYGLVQKARGARIFYTPVSERCGKTSLSLDVDPCKTAGQGFGSATGQYMDVMIKFDAETMSGYALRIERTVKNDHAVDFLLIKYDNGEVTRLTEPVTSTCFVTGCSIGIKVKGRTLTATASSPSAAYSNKDGVVRQVSLKTRIDRNPYGGVGVLLTGTPGSNAVMLHKLSVDW